MRKAIPLLLLVFSLFAGTSARASDWSFDKAHSAIRFKVKHLMVTNVWGKFKSFTGTVHYDPDDITNSSVKVTIDPSSISTDNDMRDKDLRSPRFFDVAKYPTITFASKAIRKTSDGLDIVGDLTMHGVTKEVTLHVTGPSKPFAFMGKEKMSASGETTIDRTEFGLNWNKTLETGGVLVSDDVEIFVDVELNED